MHRHDAISKLIMHCAILSLGDCVVCDFTNEVWLIASLSSRDGQQTGKHNHG